MPQAGFATDATTGMLRAPGVGTAAAAHRRLITASSAFRKRLSGQLHLFQNGDHAPPSNST